LTSRDEGTVQFRILHDLWFEKVNLYFWSQSISVSIVTRLWDGWLRLNFQQEHGRGFFVFAMGKGDACSWTHDSLLNIVTELETGWPGFNCWQGQGYFSLCHCIQTSSAAHLAPIKSVPGAVTPGLKWSLQEADHSPPSSMEVKNTWSYTSLSCTPSWCGV